MTEEEFAEQLANASSGGSGGSGGASIDHIEITQAEYDALSEEEKNADVVYFITDADGDSDGSDGLVGVELTQAEFDALTPEEKNNGLYFITDGIPLDDETELYKAVVSADFSLAANGNVLEITLPVGTYLLSGFLDGESSLMLWLNGVVDINSDEYLKISKGGFAKVLKITAEKTVFFKNLTGSSKTVYLGAQMSAYKLR